MTSSHPSQLPVVGDLVAGKYRVQNELGTGAMGVVVAAVHEQLGMLVALKFLRPEVALEPEAVERFMREGRAAASVQSEHVVRTIDVGMLDTGTPYMAMEFLKGEDLQNAIRRRGALPITEAVDYVLQACEGLAEVHAAGIVHRDLKPANLFLTQRGDGSALVKVCDFGISKGQPQFRGSLTAASAFVGSPLYSSPEQLTAARDVDARADVWALGATLFELITGDPPFQASTLPELVARIVNGRAPDLASVRPDVPPQLARVVARCLEPNLEKRFADIAELARGLANFGSEHSRISVDRVLRVLAAPTLADRPSMSPPPLGMTLDAWGHLSVATHAPARRSAKRWWLIASLSTAILALGFAAFVTTRHPPGPPASVTASASAPAVPATQIPREAPRPATTVTLPSLDEARLPEPPKRKSPVEAFSSSQSPSKRVSGAGVGRGTASVTAQSAAAHGQPTPEREEPNPLVNMNLK